MGQMLWLVTGCLHTGSQGSFVSLLTDSKSMHVTQEAAKVRSPLAEENRAEGQGNTPGGVEMSNRSGRKAPQKLQHEMSRQEPNTKALAAQAGGLQ